MDDTDVPADALTDLRSDNNELSVWAVGPDGPDLTRVLTAFASARNHLDKLDYALIDEDIAKSIPIMVNPSEAATPYSTANRLHRSLCQLSVKKIAKLAEAIMALDKKRISEKQIKTMLVDALKSGALDRTRIDPKLLSQLER